jgi:hypothetical protein
MDSNAQTLIPLKEEAHLRELKNSVDGTERLIFDLKMEMQHIIELALARAK